MLVQEFDVSMMSDQSKLQRINLRQSYNNRTVPATLVSLKHNPFQ